MIQRKYSKIIKNELKYKEISVIIGSRQVGKTTLMKELFNTIKKKVIYLTFDDIETLNLFQTNEKLFKEQFIDTHDIIFIDEFQYAKDGGRILKYLYDLTQKKFFISGSSLPELSIQSLSYLVGRIRIIEIYPIDFQEFVSFQDKTKTILLNKNRPINNFNQLDNLFNNYLTYGGYPQIVASELNEKEKILKLLVNTYLLKEIKEILEYKNIFQSEHLLKYLAVNDGGLLNKSNISNELEISKSNITQMLSMFEKTFIINIVKPFLKNKSKEEIKSPKIYFQDTGFKNSLINNFNLPNLRLDKGRIYENFVLNLLKRAGFEVFFWNYKNRYEMDFVIKKNDDIYGFEIKSKLKKTEIATSIKKFIEEFNVKKIYIVNENLDDNSIYNKAQIQFITFYNLIIQIENKTIFNTTLPKLT